MHHSSLRARRRRRAALAAGALVAAALALPSTASPAAAADACTVPQLSDVLLSQGPAAPTALVAGKTTLVKFFLGTPSCLPVGAQVQVTGAQLTVTGGSSPLAVQAALPLPPIAPSSTTPVAGSPSDVLFVVPGSALKPVTGSTVSFSAQVQYRVTVSGSALSDTVTFATLPGTTNPITGRFVSVAGLDVLVVPLATSDATSIGAQYTASTRNAVAQGFGVLRRELPLPDDGISYVETPGIKVPQVAPLCADGVKFLDIAAALELQRVTFNAVATNPHQDRVLGEIDPAVSSGPSTAVNASSACADGFAELGSKASPTSALATGQGVAAFGRAVTTPNTVGGAAVGTIMTMELAHTTGAVDAAYPSNLRSGPRGGNRSDGVHSLYRSGDPTGTLRAYDTDRHVRLTDPRSAMQDSLVGWNDANSVLEGQDWDYVLCSALPVSPGASTANSALLASLPQALTSCQNPGGFSYAAAGGSPDGTYAVAGTTDGTAEGTDAYSTDSASTTSDRTEPDSTWRVVQRDSSGAVLGNDGVPVHFRTDDHDSEGTDVALSTGVFGSSVPARRGTTTLELWKGQPGTGGTLLYSRSVTATPTFQHVEAAGGSATVSVGSPVPDRLRLDLYATCPDGTSGPLATAVRPTATTPPAGGLPGTAAFVAQYDTSAACAGATLAYHVTDGIRSATSGGGGLTGGVTTGTAEITAPSDTGVVTQFASLGLAGRVTDAALRPADRVTWTLSSPAGTTVLATSTSGTAVPPASGWPLGTSTLTLTGASGDTTLASTSRSLTFLADTDHDGLADVDEALSCYGPTAATDGTSATADSDHDGLANIDDPAPCTSANTVTVDFAPDALNTKSNGNYVTAYLSGAQVDLRTLARTDLAVLQIGGQSVARLTGDPAALTATSWSPTGPGTATVQFDRQKLITLLGTRKGYVPLVLGTLDGRVRGLDATDPNVS